MRKALFLIAAFCLVIALVIIFVQTAKHKSKFKVAVDYSQTIEQMIAAGHYDCVGSRINLNINSGGFSTSRRGIQDVEIIIVSFDSSMKSEDILRALDKKSLRSAELPELLAFGAAYPQKQREFVIVALGSVGRSRYGLPVAPAIYRSVPPCERVLDTFFFNRTWSPDFRFAAVRLDSPQAVRSPR